jgi:hypothetical protein
MKEASEADLAQIAAAIAGDPEGPVDADEVAVILTPTASGA